MNTIKPLTQLAWLISQTKRQGALVRLALELQAKIEAVDVSLQLLKERR